MYNYLVHGFSPGSFFTALLANDAMGAIQSSHPGNTIPALKNLTGWMGECCPYVARGSYENVRAWLEFTVEKRQDILEQHGLVFNKDQELILMLKNEPVVEPILW